MPVPKLLDLCSRMSMLKVWVQSPAAAIWTQLQGWTGNVLRCLTAYMRIAQNCQGLEHDSADCVQSKVEVVDDELLTSATCPGRFAAAICAAVQEDHPRLFADETSTGRKTVIETGMANSCWTPRNQSIRPPSVLMIWNMALVVR